MLCKRFLKIVYIVLVFFAVIAGALYIWQKDNIDAVINSFRYTEEEIQQQIEKSKEEVKKVTEEYDTTVKRDFTPEEEKLLESGKLTPEEAVELLFSEKKDNNVSSTINKLPIDTNKEDKNPKEKKTEKAVVDKYVTKFYACKADFLARLGALESEIVSYFESLPQRNPSTKQATISMYLGKFAALESECDGNMNALLASFEKELKEVGGNTSIVSTVKKAYSGEKNAKKAALISKYS